VHTQALLINHRNTVTHHSYMYCEAEYSVKSIGKVAPMLN